MHSPIVKDIFLPTFTIINKHFHYCWYFKVYSEQFSGHLWNLTHGNRNIWPDSDIQNLVSVPLVHCCFEFQDQIETIQECLEFRN